MNTIKLGTAPTNEEGLQLGSPMYRLKVIKECNEYIELLREVLGTEPNDSKFTVQNFSCDLGVCTEVAYTYNEADLDACEYARKCQEEAPESWD